jgi:transmembrane sensor
MEKLDYKQLVARQLAGEITAEEEAILDKWLASSPQNEAFFREMQQVWEKVSPTGAPTIPDIDGEWRQLESKLGLKKPATIRAMPQRPAVESIRAASKFRWQRYAAAAAIVFAAIGISWWLGQFGQNQRIEVVTKNAETRTVTLADGSVITLNNASKISYREVFSDSVRQIRLAGEAYFEVASEQRPFVIFTENASIRVLGTEFNIWARENETRVIVSEGRVSFRSAAAGANAGVVLSANQTAVSKGDKNPGPVLTVDTDTLLGWREGRIVFNETHLQEVIAELHRIYDVEIELGSSGLDELSISGTFQKKPLEEVLDAICLTLGIKYRIDANMYILYR